MDYSPWGHEELDMTKGIEHTLPFNDVTMSPHWIHTRTINILVSSFLQMRELRSSDLRSLVLEVELSLVPGLPGLPKFLKI